MSKSVEEGSLPRLYVRLWEYSITLSRSKINIFFLSLVIAHNTLEEPGKDNYSINSIFMGANKILTKRELAIILKLRR